MRSSSEGDVEGPLSESLEFELMEGGRRGLAGAWFPCSKLFVVAGVFPVAELLPLLEPTATPTLGGISSDSLDECVGGGLDKVLCSRLELDDSAAGRAPLEAATAAAGCNDELRAVEELDDTAAVGNSVEVVELGSADVAEELEEDDADDDDEDCCWFCNRYCCRNWIANRGNGKLRGS